MLALGILASHQAAHRTALPKPVIAPLVIDPALQGFPMVSGRSGRRNFSYAADFQSVGNEVRAFHQIVGFRHVAALVDSALLDALPELLRFREEELRTLASGLIARRLPSFSVLGSSEVESGLLMTTGGAQRDNERLARRVVLMIQRIAQGEDAASFEVSFPTEQRLVINMRTARAIGFSPRWEFLTDAERIGADPMQALPRLTLLEAMQAAIESNPALAASSARTASTGEDIRIARSELLPSLDASAGQSRIDEDRASPLTQAEETTTAGLSLTDRCRSHASALLHFCAGGWSRKSVFPGRIDRGCRRTVTLRAPRARLQVLRALRGFYARLRCALFACLRVPRAAPVRGATQVSAHADSAFSTGLSERPFAVRRYSTRTGVCGITARSTMPSASSSLRRSDSMRLEMSGMARSISAKCDAPANSNCRIAPVQRRPMISTAWQQAGQ